MNPDHALVARTAEIAKKVAGFIHEESKVFSTEKVEYKGKNDLVSYVDKSSEKLLIEGLSGLLPEASFLGEEGGIANGSSDLTWVIDPLDGTTNFTHGLPVYAISVGLRNKEEMLMGVVYEVSRNECFTAFKGGGAFLNEEKIQVSPENKLSKGLIATGFPYYDFDLMDTYLEILKHMMQNTHGVRRMGSAAVDLCYTACGRFEAFFEYNLKPWDVAGGAIIVEEAGGLVSNFDGSKTDYSGRETLAACGVHPEMIQAIKTYWDNEHSQRLLATISNR